MPRRLPACLLPLLACLALAGCHHAPPPPPPPPAAALAPADRQALIDGLDYVVAPAVFDGGKFPEGKFRNADLVKRYFGDVAATTAYYAADFSPVPQPGAPGRYGAVTTLRFPTGETVERRQTLYLAPEKVNGYVHPAEVRAVLPASLGVSAAASGQPALGRWLSDDLYGSRYRNGEAAALLAWLRDVPAGASPLPDRLGPWDADDAWWFGLRTRLGHPPAYAFLIHRPAAYDADPEKKWPLLLFLHGSGERGSDLEIVKKNGPPRLIAEGRDLPFVVVSPQCPKGEWWNSFELNALLDQVCAENRIDPGRIYVTGLSMGGFGAWRLALRYPERIAAIVPICGGGDPLDAARLRALPVWAFHGAKDPAVDPGLSRAMVAAVVAAGGKARLTLYPDAGHDSWTQAYAEPELFPWLLAQHR